MPTIVTVHLSADLRVALDRFITDMGSIATHEEALCAAFRDWAISHGYLLDQEIDEETPADGNA